MCAKVFELEEIVDNDDIGGKNRDWFITVNNWSEKEYEILLCQKERAKYCIVCKEVGEEKGVPHLHCYVYYHNAVHFNALKKLFPRANIGRRRKTPTNCIEYCKKKGVWEEFGVAPHQGARTDIEIVKSMVKNGESMRAIIDDLSQPSSQAIRTAEVLMRYIEPKWDRNIARDVIWIHGPSGVSKTRYVFDTHAGELWVSNDSMDWFDGYDRHESVLFDDLRPDAISWPKLLRLLDRYPIKVPFKGGFREWVPKTVYITSPFDPYTFASKYQLDSLDSREQLYRRIKKILTIEDIEEHYAPSQEVLEEAPEEEFMEEEIDWSKKDD